MIMPLRHVKSCSFCTDDDGHTKTGFIFPEDTLAYREADGRWKCGTCVQNDLKMKIVSVTPNSIRAREIKAEEQQQVDRWNNYAAGLNRSAGQTLMKLRTNKYIK